MSKSTVITYGTKNVAYVILRVIRGLNIKNNTLELINTEVRNF
jgi:hypothetical protein